MAKKRKRKSSISTANTRLSVARTTATDYSILDVRRGFIDKFTLCDVACRSVLESYAKNNGTYVPGRFINLDMRTIPHAMSSLGLTIPHHILNGIFGGSGQYKKRGTKSAKKLRDGIVHGMNRDDISEVVARNTDLNTMMDVFLSFFD